MSSEEIKNEIQDKLAMIADPHMGVSIVAMGLIREIQYNEESKEADITISPTNPGCMSIANIAMAAKLEAEKVEEIGRANITVIDHMMADTINDMINKEDVEVTIECVEDIQENSTITIKTIVKSKNYPQYPVNQGNVEFTINDEKLKDDNDEIIKTTVDNEIASIDYTIPKSVADDKITIIANYSDGTSKYGDSKAEKTVNIINKEE